MRQLLAVTIVLALLATPVAAAEPTQTEDLSIYLTAGENTPLRGTLHVDGPTTDVAIDEPETLEQLDIAHGERVTIRYERGDGDPEQVESVTVGDVMMIDSRAVGYSVNETGSEYRLVTGAVPGVFGVEATDPDGDQRTEDVNGDKRVNFFDVIDLLYYDDPTLAQKEAFDFDDSGHVDFLDVVTLLYELPKFSER
jgi:hypothetical protein